MREPKVKYSPHKKEIIEKMRSGVSCDTISAWLKEQGESISSTALKNWRLNNPKKLESKTVFEEGIGDGELTIDVIAEDVKFIIFLKSMINELRKEEKSTGKKSREMIRYLKLLKESLKEHVEIMKMLGVTQDAGRPIIVQKDIRKIVMKDLADKRKEILEERLLQQTMQVVRK